MNAKQVLAEAVAHPATDMAFGISNDKSYFTVKPGPYKGMANSEIVRRVSGMTPDAVILADFAQADLKELSDGFKGAGIDVTVAPYSATQL